MLTAATQKQDQIPAPSTNKKGFFFQPKLTINQPNDPDSYRDEHEANAVADKVMRMPETPSATADNKLFFSPPAVSINKAVTSNETLLKKENEEEETSETSPEIQAKLSFDTPPSPPDNNNENDAAFIQCKCAHCGEEEKQMQRKEMNNDDAGVADSSNENYISSLSGKGKSLTQKERSFFEPKMGYDFSNVQLHTNTEANQSAKSIDALAYTNGNNIVFGTGQYQPDTDEGKKLMAHELTHVVQQKKDMSQAKLISRRPKKPGRVIRVEHVDKYRRVPPGPGAFSDAEYEDWIRLHPRAKNEWVSALEGKRVTDKKYTPRELWRRRFFYAKMEFNKDGADLEVWLSDEGDGIIMEIISRLIPDE